MSVDQARPGDSSMAEKYSAVIIGCAAIIVLLGMFAAFKLPNALLPMIARPEIRLETYWPGKTVSEIEQTLIAPLERSLGTLSHLKELSTSVGHGQAFTVMIFHNDADMQQIYIDALSRINQVPNWPEQVAAPKIANYSSGASANFASFFLYSKGVADEAALIQAYRTHVIPLLSKISGIASVKVIGTPIEQRVDIEFDPLLLVQHSLTQTGVLAKLNDLADRSGGRLTMGSSEYGLHFKGQVALEALPQLPIAVNGQHIIRLGDIASVQTRLVTEWRYFALEGKRSLYFQLMPAADVNILQLIDAIKQTVAQLNDGALHELGMALAMSRDDSVAISNALMLVYGSLLLGVLLACVVLYLFLRDRSSVLLIFLGIPLCLSVVLLLMFMGGHSINVISLAGMALSVGLLLDAGIVVVENIQRLRSQGLSAHQSIRQGTREVKGALISSTLSSIIVFLPVLFMRSPESQLFKDLAFTISSALVASVLFALLLLPALARVLLRSRLHDVKPSQHTVSQRQLTSRLTFASRKPGWAKVVVVLGVPVALLMSWMIMPSLDVLPNPKTNMVGTVIRFDEPLAMDVSRREVGEVVIERIKQQQLTADLPIVTHGMLCYPTYCYLYFYNQGDWDFAAFKQWINEKVTHDLVGTRVFIRQNGLLQASLPDSRLSQLDLKGADLPTLQRVGNRLFEYLQQTFPRAQIQPYAALENRAARIEFEPKQDQLIYLGMSRSQLNRHLQALTDGIYLGNFYTGSQSLPFYFKGAGVQHLDQLLAIEIMVAGHGLMPLRDLTDAKITLAPASLLRIDQQVTVSFGLTPPNDKAMGDFVVEMESAVGRFMADEETGLYVHFGGSADNLKIFLQDFSRIFIAALLILGVLMWLSLNSLPLALAVILSMPLAIFGGMLNLQLLAWFVPQNLDVITMIGFVILMGLVINNAILLADHFRRALADGLSQTEAVELAVKTRKRPIYMSTGTTILGMLPLMLSPANSAEMYRGLAAVIVGGMTFSALFSISFMSALLSLPWYGHKKADAVTVVGKVV